MITQPEITNPTHRPDHHDDRSDHHDEHDEPRAKDNPTTEQRQKPSTEHDTEPEQQADIHTQASRSDGAPRPLARAGGRDRLRLPGNINNHRGGRVVASC